MNFTKIVHLIGGEKILITDRECEALVKLINEKPQGFIKLQNSLVNKQSIAYIGDHQSTSQIKSMDKAQAETEMKVLGKGNIVEAKKEEEKRIAIENALKEKNTMIGKEYKDWLKNTDIKQLDNKPQAEEEVMRGEPAYYLNKLGEKIYS